MNVIVPGLDPAVSDWLTRLAWSAQEDDESCPALVEAMKDSSNTWRGADYLARLIGCGWTRERLNEVLVRAREHTPNWGQSMVGDPLRYSDALRRMVLLSHLSPDEFDVWSAAFGHNIVTLTEPNTLTAIDAWRASVPGALAPYCAAAGLSLEEATAMYATGVLSEEGLVALSSLRNESTD
jgi:hypothetical protein